MNNLPGQCKEKRSEWHADHNSPVFGMKSYDSDPRSMEDPENLSIFPDKGRFTAEANLIATLVKRE